MIDKKQCYLGTKAAFVLCIDQNENQNIGGRLYHLFQEEPLLIHGYNEMFLEGEHFFESIGMPKASQSDKNFENEMINEMNGKDMREMAAEDKILNEHGEEGTFIVRVQHRQHSSWQGRVTWVDQDKTVFFRSELELMKLIDGALNEKKFEEQ